MTALNTLPAAALALVQQYLPTPPAVMPIVTATMQQNMANAIAMLVAEYTAPPLQPPPGAD